MAPAHMMMRPQHARELDEPAFLIVVEALIERGAAVDTVLRISERRADQRNERGRGDHWPQHGILLNSAREASRRRGPAPYKLKFGNVVAAKDYDQVIFSRAGKNATADQCRICR